MNKKVVIAIIGLVVVALVVLLVVYGPNLLQMLLRMHGMR